MRPLALLASFFLPAALLPAYAAPAPPFPFVIPWDDASPTAIDLSSLNTARDRIVARDGHFVESGSGGRVRFLAVNFAAGACFPEHGDAEKVAGRLAKYGVNLVRFHHMDNPWGQRGSILDDAFADRQHLQPQQLDRLDYLLAQLGKRGIYYNLNLHVSREFGPSDGFPAAVKEIPFSFDKRVDYFDRRMIALQQQYARDLLTHVNPYTGKPYTTDPFVLTVELTNEDSLVGDPWAAKGAGLEALPQPFRGDLRTRWNTWLKRKYATTAALLAAWRQGTTPPGPNLLRPTAAAASWTLEHQGEAAAALAPDTGAARVEVSRVDGTDWHVQLHQVGLDLKEGDTYTVRFRARAAQPCSVGVYTALDQADWHHVGLDASAGLGPEWKPFQHVFEARRTLPRHTRLSFSLGKQTGTVWLADVELHAGAGSAALPPGESLEQGTVEFPAGGTPTQQVDWLAFLATTERGYVDEMSRFLKQELGLRALIAGSQISWGGISGLHREAASDFADNHAYWEHPSFPHRPWDPVDWRIGNHSMIPALGKNDALTPLAGDRVAGKPYTVSEYNHPAPNEYQAECVPLFASFAAAQDWDSIYLFDYGDYGTGAQNGKIQGFFGVGSNPAKWAFVPAAALMFRQSGVPPAGGRRTLPLPLDLAALLSPATGPALSTWEGELRQNARTARLEVAPGAAAAINQPGASPVDWQTADPQSARYVADAPAAKVVAGFVGGQAVKAGDATFTFGETPNRFAVATLTAMDGKPLAQSAKALLTTVDRVESSGMRWNTDRTSVGSDWGQGPTLADGVPLTVSLPVDGPRKVHALSATGARGAEVKSTYASGKLAFTVGPAQQTVWYVILK